MTSIIPTDANSVNVTPPQDTPMSNRRDGKYINFGVDVEIQKPIEKFPRGKKIIIVILIIVYYSRLRQKKLKSTSINGY